MAEKDRYIVVVSVNGQREFSGYVETTDPMCVCVCAERKGGMGACCSDAGSDKTVPCDATVSRNAKGPAYF